MLPPLTEIRPGRHAMSYDKLVEKLPHCPLHASDFDFFPLNTLTNPEFSQTKNRSRAGISPDRLDEQRH